MKTYSILSIVLTLLLSACIPGLTFQPTLPVDLQATAVQMANTFTAQTIESMPKPTLETFTETPVLEATLPPTQTPSPTLEILPTQMLFTPTITFTPVPSPTSTPGIFNIDDLPEDLPSALLKLEDKAKGGVSLTLYLTTVPHGYQTILYYDFTGTLLETVPQGNFTYVAYVGGAKFVGYFSLTLPYKLTMTFYKDRVAIH